MRAIPCFGFVLCLAALSAAPVVSGEEHYFNVPVSRLTLTEGTLPDAVNMPGGRWERWELWPLMRPYTALDSAGEVYVSAAGDPPWMGGRANQPTSLLIRAEKGGDLTGRLFLPQTNMDGMVMVKFKIALTDAQSESKSNFYAAKEAYYRELQSRGIPGAAWFRHQAQEAALNLGQTNSESGAGRFNRRWRPAEVEDGYELFTGGRAISENLQLDRVLPASKAAEETIDLTNLTGITIKEMNWKELITNAAPQLDYLAGFLPADQHAIFFPSFQAMTTMIDEADANGTPVLQLLEPRSEDANTRSRYQRQLCLGLTDISRMFGPQVIKSVAFTGSDPYLRVGTDVAVLFEAANPDLLKTYLAAQQKAVQTTNAGAKPVAGSIDGVAYAGLVSPDRSVSSYVASVSNAVIVCNSRVGLENLVRVAKGKAAALSSQDDYIFFRNRYPRSDKNETALAVLTDATIRRWCGPQWRIMDARRTRAAAALCELQAAHVAELASGKAADRLLPVTFQLPDAGEFRLTPAGVMSSVYGTLDFMTPIVEIPLPKVTVEERAAYERWRDDYQRNWRQVFDPIAIRFAISRGKIGADLTVTPLILSSDYHRVMDFVLGAAIGAGAGDPHSNALFHLVFAVNSQAQSVQDAGNFIGTMAPGLKANAFGWMGQSIAVYADEDPFWQQLVGATNTDEFLEKHFPELPVALRFEVKNALGLAGFLTAVHAFADQTAPGLATWQTLSYKDQTYVKITAKNPDEEEGPKEFAVYYAATSKALIVTMKESVLKQALDRQLARAGADGKEQLSANPWLGKSVCAVAERRFFDVLRMISRESYETHLQVLAWSNLPILNEWKRLYPDKDPVVLHEQLWGTRLLCPGGGKYVWNENWQTMESTVFGHPAQPRTGTAPGLRDIDSVRLGVTFENQGLSASGVLTKRPAK